MEAAIRIFCLNTENDFPHWDYVRIWFKHISTGPVILLNSPSYEKTNSSQINHLKNRKVTFQSHTKYFLIQTVKMGHLIFYFLWCCSPTWALASSFSMRFLDHTQPRTTVGRTPLDEWSARYRDLYLTTHNTHNRQTSMPPPWDSNPRSQQASGRRRTP